MTGRMLPEPGRQYPAAGTEAPVDDPPTGSAMTAATVSGPSRTDRRLDRLPAAAPDRAAAAPRHSQR